MRTGRKHRASTHQQAICMVERLECRQLMATISGTNTQNVSWDWTPGEWAMSDITISGAPANAVATSATVSWQIDSDYVSGVSYALARADGKYASNIYSGLYDTGGDPYITGYMESSVDSTVFALPAGVPVNGTWQFGAMDNTYYMGGQINSWSITITYTTPAGSPEIQVTTGGASNINIADNDSTPSTADNTDFGTANRGAAGISKTFTVKNTGTADLTLGSVSVPAGYTISQNLPSFLTAGTSANLIVTLGTATAGTFAGDISFATNDSDENPFNFRITGTVIVPNQAPTDLALSANTIAENRPSGTAVGTFSTTDPDSGNTFTYTFASGGADNTAFTISGNTLQTNSSFDYETKSSYAIRIRSTDQGGLWTEKAFTINVTDVDEIAPTVSSVTINDGALQRSMVKKLTVTFSEAVNFSTDAFTLKLSSGLAVAATLTVLNPSLDQQTYTITFSGTGVISGSLADGIYDLTISAARVQDLAGNTMAADYTKRFHRLFGDVDGNKVVNIGDYAKFKATFGRFSTDPLFNSGLDYDNNNVINIGDYAQFKKRFGLIYSY